MAYIDPMSFAIYLSVLVFFRRTVKTILFARY